jgi:hypothetical protein
MQMYEALLARPEHIEQVRQARANIERLGGKVEIAPPSTAGMVLVTLTLPPGYMPEHILPGLPFYPA